MKALPVATPMRLVFINPLSEIGGAERSLLAWMGATRQAMPDAELLLLLPGDGPLARSARDLGAAVMILPLPRVVAAIGDSALAWRGSALGSLNAGGHIDRMGALLQAAMRCVAAAPAAAGYAWRLRRLLRQLGPSLVHSNGLKPHLLVWLALHGPRIKPAVVWHLHDFPGQRTLVQQVLRWASGGATAAVAVSQAVARDAADSLGISDVTVIHNATNVEHFRPAPLPGRLLDELAGLAPAGNGMVRVVLVATYATWKGHDTFLEAASRVAAAAGPPARFYLVGGPIYQTRGSQYSQAELQDRAARLGIRDRVGFIGFRSDPAGIYQAADVVVHASTRPEPFGLTIIEAMACGKPVIVSQAGGAAELFTDGVEALGVTPGDPEALAAAMKRLIGDRGLRERMGGSAREAAIRRFDERGLTTKVRAFYMRVLNGGSFRSASNRQEAGNHVGTESIGRCHS